MIPRLVVVVLIVLVGLGCLLAMGWLYRLGGELAELPHQSHLLQEAASRRTEIDRSIEKANRRIIIKCRVIQDLLEGRTTLVRAAAVFRHVDESYNYPRPQVETLPGATLDENACHEVIRWVRTSQVGNSKGEKPDLIRRLETELASLLSSPGGLKLPEVVGGDFLD